MSINKIAVYQGGQWITEDIAVAASAISGSISSSQIENISGSKIIGNLYVNPTDSNYPTLRFSGDFSNIHVATIPVVDSVGRIVFSDNIHQSYLTDLTGNVQNQLDAKATTQALSTSVSNLQSSINTKATTTALSTSISQVQRNVFYGTAGTGSSFESTFRQSKYEQVKKYKIAIPSSRSVVIGFTTGSSDSDFYGFNTYVYTGTGHELLRYNILHTANTDNNAGAIYTSTSTKASQTTVNCSGYDTDNKQIRFRFRNGTNQTIVVIMDPIDVGTINTDQLFVPHIVTNTAITS